MTVGPRIAVAGAVATLAVGGVDGGFPLPPVQIGMTAPDD